MTKSRWFYALVVLLFCLSLNVVLSAQTITGSVTGTVTDRRRRSSSGQIIVTSVIPTSPTRRHKRCGRLLHPFPADRPIYAED